MKPKPGPAGARPPRSAPLGADPLPSALFPLGGSEGPFRPRRWAVEHRLGRVPRARSAA